MNEKQCDQTIELRAMISIADLLERIPISRSTLDRLVKEGSFPKPCYLTPMKLGFYLDEVVAWQKELLRGKSEGVRRPDYRTAFRKPEQPARTTVPK
ncbi:prophage regulatory protein [Bradyrhizobium sp. AZCC 1578]|uniref:helix-turn-helix transcriptional regulator n=1 Tax=Bradyrhizobium sp. AZCC 1578 TaxID=3117027 RepID=UPI002FF0B795